jgi:hypothetical protein
MSDNRMQFIAFEGRVRIILAGISDLDSIAGMMGHVFKASGIIFELKPYFSESDNCISDIALMSAATGENNNELSDIEAIIGQLKLIAANISDGGTLIYSYDDEVAREVASESRADIKKIAYRVHGYFQNKLGIFAATHNRTVPVKFGGDENMSSLSAAREVCLAAGVSEDDFYLAIKSFD